MSVEMTIRLVLIATLVSLIAIGFAMGEDTYTGRRHQPESPEQPHALPDASSTSTKVDAA